jgi:arylsulfatase A-like enzyme
VIRYPGFDPTFQNGTLLRAFSTVADLCPTILDLAGVSHPCPDGQAAGSWRDRTVAGMRGKSWVRYFSGEQLDGISAIHSDDDPAFGWELFGRAGQWTEMLVPSSPLPLLPLPFHIPPILAVIWAESCL